MTAVKQRLHYFDMLKGIAIFMVVMGHVLTMCVREIDRAPLFKFIGAVHMPLFFFISGWMTYKADGRGVGLGKRAAQLLVPMAFMSSLWVWYFPHSGLQSPLNSTFSGLWHDQWKNGYWFTLVLFEIIAVYAAVNPLLKRVKSFVAEIAVYLLASVALYLLFLLCPAPVCDVLSLQLLVSFFPVFCFGALAHRHKEEFDKLVTSPIVFTAAIVVCCFSMYLECWPWEFPWLGEVLQDVNKIVLRACLAIVGIAVVKPWSIEAFGVDAPRNGKPLARAWVYLGKESLAIYLLHYFFLFPLGCVRGALTDCGLSFVPLLVFSAVVAACIIAVVLCVNRILQPSGLLSWLMCGRLPQFFKKQK